MKYSEFEAEHFLLDDSFIQFCMQNDADAVKYWQDWLQLHPEHAQKIAQAREMYFLLNGNITPAVFAADRKAFEAAFSASDDNQSVSKPARQPSLVRYLRKHMIALAAAVAIIAVSIIGFIYYRGSDQHAGAVTSAAFRQESRPGERKTFQLADGTQVTLNAGSTLTIAGNFNTLERRVILHGEAFFEVIHDKTRPFVIHTNDMDVRVLGTVFNVKAYDNDNKTETSLISGSVEVTLLREHNRKITLVPKEKIVYHKLSYGSPADSAKAAGNTAAGTAAIYDVVALTHPALDSSYNEVSWLDNRLSFSQERLGDIVPQLERWFDISIRITDSSVSDFRYTGTFKKKTVKQVLDALQLSKSFTYNIVNNHQITISK